MESLTLSPTASTPEVSFNPDTGLLIIKGESYPENSLELFQPLLAWVSEFLENSPLPIKLEIGLTYLNTSSIKSLMDLLDLLEEAHKESREVTVTWFYDEDNDRALEMAEEFREEVTLPFFLVPQK